MTSTKPMLWPSTPDLAGVNHMLKMEEASCKLHWDLLRVREVLNAMYCIFTFKKSPKARNCENKTCHLNLTNWSWTNHVGQVIGVLTSSSLTLLLNLIILMTKLASVTMRAIYFQVKFIHLFVLYIWKVWLQASPIPLSESPSLFT